MRLPTSSERKTIYGMTGTGKTNAGLWDLEQRNFDSMPWVILDFKRDDLIGAIDAKPWALGRGVPSEPGIYVVRPRPFDDAEAVDRLLLAAHAQGNTGIFIDEAYMIDARSKALMTVITQGRSLRVPLIALTQRPVWMSRYLISEAEFQQVFFLADENDREAVQRFIPRDVTKREPKRRFGSWHYVVPDRDFDELDPLPPPEVVISRINERLDELEDDGPNYRWRLKRPVQFI